MKDYEQIISTLLTKIAELEQIVKQQAARITDLERRLNKNSSNSSKPPSSDGLGKPPRTTSLRENGKHKSGGQKGHKGETLKQIETPDIVKKYVLTTCPDCHHPLLQSPSLGILKREKQIKELSRKKKNTLVNAFNPEWNDLYQSIC